MHRRHTQSKEGDPIGIAVFTDLDGTLLDHHSYAHEAAAPALAALQRRGIPLYLNSSKTVGELREIAAGLDLNESMVAENGAAVVTRHGETLQEFGLPRHQLLKVLRDLRSRHHYDFVGFADMSTQQIAAATGLPDTSAALAADKRWSEPLLWRDSESRLADFEKHLQDAGLRLTRGGRFLHVSSPFDKGQATRWLQASECPNSVLVALGDGENDRPMLELADIPVVVRSPVYPPLQLKNPRAIITDDFGPTGWNRTILDLLDTL